jgi:hypothetical protein
VGEESVPINEPSVDHRNGRICAFGYGGDAHPDDAAFVNLGLTGSDDSVVDVRGD